MRSWAEVKRDVTYRGEWYVIKTFGGREDYASDWLIRRMNAECYFPLSPREVEIPDPTDKTAAITGYIFARFPDSPDWFEILESEYCCRDIISPIYTTEGDERRPYLLCDDVVQGVKSKEARGFYNKNKVNIDDVLRSIIYMKIQIPCGPFMGHTGKIVEADIKGNFARLRVRMLGKDCYLGFALDALFPDGLPA